MRGPDNKPFYVVVGSGATMEVNDPTTFLGAAIGA